MKLWKSATATNAPAIVFVPDLERWLAASPGVLTALEKLRRVGLHDWVDHDGFGGQWLVDHAISPAPLWRALAQWPRTDEVLINVTPLALRPDLNAVWARPMEDFSLGDVIAVCEELIASTDFALEQDASGLFLVAPRRLGARLQPIWALDGLSLDALMPQGEKASRWVQFISESQILLHHRAKHTDGGPPVPQGLWFWGAGSMPDPTRLSPRVHTVAAETPELNGLAEALKIHRRSPYQHGVEAIGAGELIEFMPPSSGDAKAALHALNASLKTLIRRVGLGRLSGLELTTRHQRWRLTPKALWRSALRLSRA